MSLQSFAVTPGRRLAGPAEPLLTVVVPAYNAEEYLRRALDSLGTVAGIEVIVVNDGSSDRTGEIADDYARCDPSRFRVVHQLNSGHGGAINAGIRLARGEYLKVLDADDWFDIASFPRVLQHLIDLDDAGGVDAVFTDYVHERLGKTSRTTRFSSVFPVGRVFGWADVARFGRRQYLMMHAIIYRTELLRASGLELPQHTFYVDNLYVLTPLVRVRRMSYLPVPMYRYFIGRDDQSVNPAVMVRRVEHQLRVNKLALETLPAADAVTAGHLPPELYATMLHYLAAVCAVTSATLARSNTAEHLAARSEFWRALREEDQQLYARMRRSFIGTSSNLPGNAGRRITSAAYVVARRVVGFS